MSTGIYPSLRGALILEERLAFDQPRYSEGQKRSRLENEHGADIPDLIEAPKKT